MDTMLLNDSTLGVEGLDTVELERTAGGDGVVDVAIKAFVTYLINHADDVVKGVQEGWNAT